jgi:LPS sulfotransferase NodH
MPRFDSFVLFAEMRTGSNFLEANLNSLPGVACYGEAFNPHFIGYPDRPDLLGVTLEQRVRDPRLLLAAIRGQPGVMGGFRFFNDHDPRVLDLVLPDPACAKIVLTRNPVDSYVSRRIAAATGQWKLTNARHAKSETIRFSPDEFEAHLERLQAFQLRLLHALQTTGQTAFYLDYEDVQDVAVINGLAAFLGVEGRLKALDRRLKKQNPEPIEDKVRNFPEMEAALARLDRFNLGRTPCFEPRRGPAIPTLVAAPRAPLLYLPVKSGPDEAVRSWLSALDGGLPPVEGFTFRSLRQWKAARPLRRSFTVLRHPLARAHAAFCDRILPAGEGAYPEVREHLRRHFGLEVPAEGVGPDWTDADHARAFAVFLTFLKANLAGQTALRVDAAWASQVAVLQGIAAVQFPDMILREETLARDLAQLAAQVGREAPPPPAITDPHAALLARIRSPALEALSREACARDYAAFGFGDWTG